MTDAKTANQQVDDPGKTQPPTVATSPRTSVPSGEHALWVMRIVAAIAWMLVAVQQVTGFFVGDFTVAQPHGKTYLDLIGVDATSLALIVWCGALGGGINSFLAEGKEYNLYRTDGKYPSITLAESIWSAFRPAMSLVVGVITVLFVKLGLLIFGTATTAASPNVITLALVSFFGGLSSVNYLQSLAKRIFGLLNFDKKAQE